MKSGIARAVWAFAAATLLLTHSGRSECAGLSQTAPVPRSAPCSDGAYRQFDFWIGNWDVVDVAHPTVMVAHVRVESILNGCVIHEVYEGVDGHKGESFSIYDASRNRWHQCWVTDHGYLLTIEGHLQGDAMILEGTDHLPDGNLRQVRGEWRLEKDGVREVAARSIDGGTTWSSWFDLLFRSHAGRY